MSSEQIPENNTPPVETPKTETPTETTQTPETKTEGLVSSTTSSTVQTAKSWKETISEEYRNDPNIAKFTEIDALAKSYINATRMIGTDKVAIPNKNFTEDQWNEFYNKVGRPETPDKYNLSFKSDNFPTDEGQIKTFQENAHKLGLSTDQAQGILDYYKNLTESSAKQQQVDLETSQAQSQQLLKEEWGKNYEANLKRAAGVAKANLSPKVLDLQMQDGSRLGDNVDVIKGFAKIANLLSEDKIVATESETQMPNKDIETEISQIINNKQGPYWNKGHPEHDKTVQQVLTLREMLDGSSK